MPLDSAWDQSWEGRGRCAHPVHRGCRCRWRLGSRGAWPPLHFPSWSQGAGRAPLSLPSAAANIWACGLPCRRAVCPSSLFPAAAPPSSPRRRSLKGGADCRQMFKMLPGLSRSRAASTSSAPGQPELPAPRKLAGVPALRQPNGTRSTSAKQTPVSKASALHRDRSNQSNDSSPPRL